MRETITRCNICKKEDCDGVEYRLKIDRHISYYVMIKLPEIVCSSQLQKGIRNDHKKYYYQSEFGITYRFEIKKIERVERKAQEIDSKPTSSSPPFPDANLIEDIDIINHGTEEFLESDILYWDIDKNKQRWLVVERNNKEAVRYNATYFRWIKWLKNEK